MINVNAVRFFFALLIIIPSIAYAETCETNFSHGYLTELKAEQFVIENEKKRNQVAIKFLSCLGHEAPEIRDGVIYEGLSHWLRNQQLEEQTIKTLFESLTTLLANANQDQNNFVQPFASLVMSEVVRVDRITPYLSEQERQRAVDVSTQYMSSITDYRGFNDKDGWRHAVAHTSDIFLQLALNESISKEQLNQLLEAINQQVSPTNGHSYIHGEPKRLATAFAYIALRGEQTEEEIANTLNKIANPSPFEDWNSVYKSEEGLSKLHNTRAFIYSLFALSSQSKNPNLIAIQPVLATIIRELG
jgi:hypothetical protein